MAAPLDKMYYFVDPGNTTLEVSYTNRASVVNYYIEKIQKLLQETDDKIVGLDVEYTNEQSLTQKAVVVQLRVGMDFLVYHIFQADQPCLKLVEFLANPNISFAGVNIVNDRIKLRHSLVPLKILVDIQKRWKPAGSMNEKDSLADYAMALIDIRYKVMKKKKEDVDHKQWGNMPLSEEQIKYASLDAYVTYEVYRRIVNFEKGQQTLEMFNQKKN